MPDFIELHHQRLLQLEKIIGYSFNDKELLRQSLTHKSFMNEQSDLGLHDNEALEFLGDSVMGFLISSTLYQRFGRMGEGELSRYRSFLVSGQHLMQIARTLQLGDFILLGRGEQKTRGHQKKNILADAFEALVAAIYLDGGIRPVKAFIGRVFKEPLNMLQQSSTIFFDAKTQLQEYLANSGRSNPQYLVVDEQGPDHNKMFFIRLDVDGETAGRGQGRSKKEAQQMAALEALELFRRRDGFPDASAPR